MIRITDDVAMAVAEELTRGTYQYRAVHGRQMVSGSDLKGKARKYAGKYRASMGSLRVSMLKAGLEVKEISEAHGKRVWVVSAPKKMTQRVKQINQTLAALALAGIP